MFISVGYSCLNNFSLIMITIWPLILMHVIFTTYATVADKNLKLQFVQILFRHGDRSPIDLYPNDPNPSTVWTEGLGQLTLLGRKQHYGLGTFFRSYYKDFITSSPLEVNVISSDVERCLQSAETNMASFYAPDKEWKFLKDFNWQPIAVHYIERDEDKYLETSSYCPKADAEQKNVIDSPEGREFIANHKDMFDNLTVCSGSSITDWETASYLHDALWIEKKYNFTTPKCVEPFWTELEEVSDLSFFWSFNSPLLHRLRAGPLLQRIIKKMNAKIDGETPNLKIQIYSAHDTNVAVVLDSLNLFNMKQPPYCASLLFELYSGSNKSTFIRLLYLNSTEPEKGSQVPHVLILDGCTEFCPFTYFINYTKHLMPVNWEEECQLSKSFIEKVKEKGMTIIIIFSVVILVVIITSLVAIWRLAYKRDKYAYHLMPMN